MPFKHQENSYRVRKGKHFVAYTDECPSRRSAFETARNLRESGRKAFFVKMDNGAFWRVFVEDNKKQE